MLMNGLLPCVVWQACSSPRPHSFKGCHCASYISVGVKAARMENLWASFIFTLLIFSEVNLSSLNWAYTFQEIIRFFMDFRVAFSPLPGLSTRLSETYCSVSLKLQEASLTGSGDGHNKHPSDRWQYGHFTLLLCAVWIGRVNGSK